MLEIGPISDAVSMKKAPKIGSNKLRGILHNCVFGKTSFSNRRDRKGATTPLLLFVRPSQPTEKNTLFR